jgi:hypothetical protein
MFTTAFTEHNPSFEAETRERLHKLVLWIVDDAGGCYDPDCPLVPVQFQSLRDSDTLVAFETGFEPTVIAVRSYLDGVVIDEDEAVEIASEFLAERNRYEDGEQPPVLMALAGRQPPKPTPESAHEDSGPGL